eukprot:TRINITY_DN2748_c0_g1_i1.p2 TRINITY_DN2748_c0_g1~~TRINITY_DN2748_c0_g1_i1.p2  ORF type:complete len:457 (+),score=91.61 TRINITY_DN2748_c0_g1_i1:28-1398(+)
MEPPYSDWVRSIETGSFGVVIGSGMSVAATYDPTCDPPYPPTLAWLGLLKDGVEHCCHRMADGDALLFRSDCQDLIDDENYIELAHKVRISLESDFGNKATFKQWLNRSFTGINIKNDQIAYIYRKLAESGCFITTTNYDDLIENSTDLQTIHRSYDHEVSEYLRGEIQGVFHFHGHYKRPEDVVLGADDYGNVLNDDRLQLAMRSIAATKTLLFIGCGVGGITDPNMKSFVCEMAALNLGIIYILVPQFEVSDFNGIPGVVVCSYGDNYNQLVPCLSEFVSRLTPKKNQRMFHILCRTGSSEPYLFAHNKTDHGFYEIFLKRKKDINNEKHNTIFTATEHGGQVSINLVLENGKTRPLHGGVEIGASGLYRIAATMTTQYHWVLRETTTNEHASAQSWISGENIAILTVNIKGKEVYMRPAKVKWKENGKWIYETTTQATRSKSNSLVYWTEEVL